MTLREHTSKTLLVALLLATGGLRAGLADAQPSPPSPCHPVINEVLAGLSAITPTVEFVELFNPCATAFTLDGWLLHYRRNFPTRSSAVLSILQGVLQPGGYQVYASPGYHGPSNGALLTAMGVDGPGGIDLMDHGDAVDRVSWWPSTSITYAGVLLDPSAAPAPVPWESLSRMPNGMDTNVNTKDFKGTSPTPMAANGTLLSTCHPVINEVLTGTSATPAEEFVELFNPCATAFTLDGWFLVSRSATNMAPASSLDLPGTQLLRLQGVVEPGGYRVYGGPGYDSPANGTLQSSLEAEGAVGLRDVTLSLIDSVGFGQVSGNAFVEGTATPVAPLSSPPGQSLSRFPNGMDSNNNGSDFKLTPPTPMAANALAPSVRPPGNQDGGQAIAPLPPTTDQPTDLSVVTQNWDKNLPAAERFVILTAFKSEAVLDRNTGLVWEVSPDPRPIVWEGARGSCANKSVGGVKGWRLPSFPELASLLDMSVQPFVEGEVHFGLTRGHPFKNIQPNSDYWSATTHAGYPEQAYIVEFNLRGFVGPAPKSSLKFAWCVRGPGMNADQY
jgi:hypothetical protein